MEIQVNVKHISVNGEDWRIHERLCDIDILQVTFKDKSAI
jgi:hypothetical protein